ncbi:ribonuclease-3 family protein [Clostridium cavendishii DSM 21758]|uniref:Mini-ribonuclease 3 n=1 Tax=Clostridium cavendishii DSM 21758 TaxID=1121302 RepID=A0A1M6V362_9CLOT|nr:Mini-ribonuclease 3 [Clostridium cavendishii]SHK75903.1 ribonuclease-3 family protein [Clostridium cavendishii DSM 21758]
MLDNLLFKELNQKEARLLNPLQLALIGDGVYEVFIRNYILFENRGLSAHKLHVKAITYVKAHAQSQIMKALEELLTEDETYIYKRGRNAKSGTVPKNADVVEYRTATGFEALIGYLYLTNQKERLSEILLKTIEVKE